MEASISEVSRKTLVTSALNQLFYLLTPIVEEVSRINQLEFEEGKRKDLVNLLIHINRNLKYFFTEPNNKGFYMALCKELVHFRNRQSHCFSFTSREVFRMLDSSVWLIESLDMKYPSIFEVNFEELKNMRTEAFRDLFEEENTPKQILTQSPFIAPYAGFQVFDSIPPANYNSSQKSPTKSQSKASQKTSIKNSQEVKRFLKTPVNSFQNPEPYQRYHEENPIEIMKKLNILKREKEKDEWEHEKLSNFEKNHISPYKQDLNNSKSQPSSPSKNVAQKSSTHRVSTNDYLFLEEGKLANSKKNETALGSNKTRLLMEEAQELNSLIKSFSKKSKKK